MRWTGCEVAEYVLADRGIGIYNAAYDHMIWRYIAILYGQIINLRKLDE